MGSELLSASLNKPENNAYDVNFSSEWGSSVSIVTTQPENRDLIPGYV